MSAPTTVIAEQVYTKDPVFRAISDRFWSKYKISVREHIEYVIKLGHRLEQGFDFVPMLASAWEEALIGAGFENDKRERHLGFLPSVGSIAAAATQGEGYREPGSPSLHCAVAPSQCNVHLDAVGFKVNGSYGPDAPQHIVDELIWQDKIVKNLERVLPKWATDGLYRLHPIVPSSRQIEPYKKEVGVQVDLVNRRRNHSQQQILVTVDVSHSCADNTCGAWRKIQGKSIEAGENKVMLMFKVFGM